MLFQEMSKQRYPNKVRTDETGDVFRDKVLKILRLKRVPDLLTDCNWEDIHNLLSVHGKTLAQHLSLAVADQDLCLTSLIIQSGEIPSKEAIEAAAQGSSRILLLCLSSPKAQVSYQALLYAVDSNKEENVKILLDDRRAPVVPLNSNQPSLLATAVKNNNQNIVRLLVQDNRVDPSGADNKALVTASYANNVPMMKLLLDSGADPNARESPFVAATVGNVEAVQFLLSDPRVRVKSIPVVYLRTADENRDGSNTRPTANRDLPVKDRATYNRVVELLNLALYEDKIAGLFLGYHLATGHVDPELIYKLLTASNNTSKYLRYLTLESPTSAQAIEWLINNGSNFSREEKEDLIAASESIEGTELEGNIAIAAFFRLSIGWTFQEIYEEVSRKQYEQATVIMTCLLVGGFMGLKRALTSGIVAPSVDLLTEAEQFTRSTKFGVLRQLN